MESKHGSVIIGDRVVKVDAFPIGIDYQKFVHALSDETTLKEMEIVAKHYRGQKILLSLRPSDFVLCMGDDYTDEDMFHAMPEEAYSIKVGVADTSARFQIGSIDKALQLLQKLL